MAAQGPGLAALIGEKDAFPFAAVSTVMTAVVATCPVSVPAVEDLLMSIALTAAAAPKVVEVAAKAVAEAVAEVAEIIVDSVA